MLHSSRMDMSNRTILIPPLWKCMHQYNKMPQSQS